MDGIPVLVLCSSLLLFVAMSAAADTINTTQSIRDGQSIVSAGGSFELGFFSPESSSKRYLGIWYHKVTVKTVVWVANRAAPLADSSGVLNFTNQGILVLRNSSGTIIWSSDSSGSARNPVAQILDSGNLIVKNKGDNNLETFLWQSFDYPCDTYLPGMKLGRNKIKGLDWYLSSWKATDDPSHGNFTYGFDAAGYPEIILRENSLERYRSGPWNGLRFSGMPRLSPNPIFSSTFVVNEKEISLIYQLVHTTIPTRFVITHNGIFKLSMWINQKQGWLSFSEQNDNCDQYKLCGSYGSCDIKDTPMCSCIKGFVPKVPNEWDVYYWSNGCVRNIPLNCSGDGFRKYSGVKLPGTRKSWFNATINLQECETLCKNNCSCTAYTNLDIRDGGSGCLLWFDDLNDIRELVDKGQDIYVRLAASELDHSENMKQRRIVVSSVLSTGLLFLLILAMVFYVRKKNLQKYRKTASNLGKSPNSETQKQELELPFYDLDTIASATNDFSIANKLGEGGFGPVYKGKLKDGQEIAVKRLSKNSRQGLNEFKNEVMHIAKLQHRNLVKLLGCCIQEDEKLLIYEFMPNKSLDSFIFDPRQTMKLDWPQLYHIINGIARGLLYLHQDSRLRIIHRDLKVSNILLDNEMNPKISDFGLAKSFGGNETQGNTNKVVGTYGYMSPEYAIDGLYSVKSDVFSFGVMVLEIVSGKRNRGFCHPQHHFNLLGHAWTLYREGRSSELNAASGRDSCNLSEVLRSIHIGLLCVQRNPEDRPSMSSVALMLSGEGVLPEPKQPGFFNERDPIDADSSSSVHEPCSGNNLTLTLEAR